MSDDGEQTRTAAARVGSVLKDKWTIDRVLGVGGMASVYAATHRNQKRVAIKMLHPELSASADVRARFLREGYVANTVGHRGAVAVDDEDVSEDGAAFLVMELLEGETLEARRTRKGGQLPAEDVLSLMDQLLDVLAAAHEKGIVHRDLKPENLFFTHEGVLKVLDFGIARLRDGSMGGGSEGASGGAKATRAGSVMGTPAFMAPEQARARWELVDGQTDLWAVGATMFTLLAGRFVREADTVNEELALAITAHAPPLATVLPEALEPIAAVVDKALAYDKALRFPDARSMQVAVREAYHALAGAAPVGKSGQAPPPRPVLPSMLDLSGAAALSAIAGRSQPPPGTPTGAVTAATAAPSTLHNGTTSVPEAPAPGAAKSKLPIFIGAGVAVAALVAFLATRGSGSAAGTVASAEPSSAPVATATASAVPPVVTAATTTVTAAPTVSAAPVASAAPAESAAPADTDVVMAEPVPDRPVVKSAGKPLKPAAKPGKSKVEAGKKPANSDPFSRRN